MTALSLVAKMNFPILWMGKTITEIGVKWFSRADLKPLNRSIWASISWEIICINGIQLGQL